MKLTDFIGNELKKGDIVVLDMPHICGQIVELNTGEIARGVSISGQPKGEVGPPMVAIAISMTTLQIAGLDGKFSGLVKVEKPPAPQEEKSLLQ